MTRVIARPRALLDGENRPSVILMPGSDAERYMLGEKVLPKLGELATSIQFLDQGIPRMPTARSIRTDAGIFTAIQGEDTNHPEPPVGYAFSLGPDSGEYIGIGRIAGNHYVQLAWADPNEDKVIFHEPDGAGTITDPAKVNELIQLLAAAVDATEEALT